MSHGRTPGDRGQRWALELELSTQSWCWQLSWDIREDQCVLLTAEPLSSPYWLHLYYCSACVGMHMMQGAWWSRGTAVCVLWWVPGRRRPCPFTMWVPGVRLRISGSSTYRATSPVQTAILNKLPEQQLHNEKLDACANSRRSPTCSRNDQKTEHVWH